MKYKNILVEGCDGSGKSTFLNDLEERMYYHDMGKLFEIRHNGPFESSLQAFKEYEKQLDSSEESVLFDRAHLSEFVYGTVFRKSPPDRMDFLKIDDRFRENTLLIYCKPPFNTVRNNWKARYHEEMIDKEQDLYAIYKLYDYAVQSMTEMHYLQYDYRRDGRLFLNNVCRILLDEG